ncbi:stAR-related lipid transfer protein 9-like [Discoglossus pictus]
MANVRVALRVRPLSKRETSEGTNIIVNTEDTIARIRNAKLDHRPEGCGDTRERLLEFSFDYCYWSVDPDDPKYASQEVVFQDLGTSVLSEALKGYNVCLFAYGQTGSGKTYTMMGTPSSVGLTPRICEGLFSCDDGSPGSPSSYRIKVSFLEIYNERVRDLLNQSEQKKPYTLRVREHPEKGPYVQDLSQHVVTNYEQVVSLLKEGMQNRITAATHIHDASSRSHAIFTIQYTQAMLEDNLPSEITSKINLVDLAGSERASPNYCKDRLTEGSNINRSLVTLGIVISALAQTSQMTSSCQSINSIASDGDSGIPSSPSGGSKRQPYIPYRDSILTWLLKDSLGGNSKTIMIATVSPASGSYNETMSTLRYASNAKNIINKPRVNEDANVKLIRDLREEINRLKNMLRNFEMRTISPSFSDEREGNLTDIVLQNELKIEQLTKDWTDKWTDKAAIMEQYNVDINKDKAGLTIDSSLPHLIATDNDILSTGVVIYHLREGTTKIGGSDSEQEQDIVLQGDFIENEHCAINNHCGTVELRPFPGAHCTVNGQDVTRACRLSQGAVIVLGKIHRFRFNHPAEAAVLRRRRSDGKTSFLSSGSLDWLDLSGDFSTSSNRISLTLNARKTDPLNEEYQEKLKDLEAFYRQQVEEQQHYVEDLKKQIQATQVKDEKELEHEQSLINQLIENQQLLVKEAQCLTTRVRESGVQTEPKTYLEAEGQNSVETDIEPTPSEQDRKRLVQLELLCNCSLRRAEKNIKRKKVKFQLERIVKKQKLLEARRHLQELQEVCWISEDRVKQTLPYNPNTQESAGRLTTLRRSRSSPSGFANYRRCSVPWLLPPYSAFKKRKSRSEQTALAHNYISIQGNKPRRAISLECLPKPLYNNLRRGNSDQTCSSTTALQEAESHTSEFTANNTSSCCGNTLLINYPPMSVKQKKMDKTSKAKGVSIKKQTEPPKKKNVRPLVNTAFRETKPKSFPQASGSLKKSYAQELVKGNQKNEGNNCPTEKPTKNPQRSVTLGKPPFRPSSLTMKSNSTLPNIQNKYTDKVANISVSVENINTLGSQGPLPGFDRKWKSTERLCRGLLKPTTDILENCNEDDESESSDTESFYSVDSLSSAYVSVLNEQLQMEELERNTNVTSQKGSDSEDSQISQDSLMEREKRKKKSNKKTLNKYKTILTHSSCSALPSEQIVSPLVKSGSITSGLSKSFSLDSLADAEEVLDAESSEEVPAEIFWELQSPVFSVPQTENKCMFDITQRGANRGMVSSSFYLNPDLSSNFSDTIVTSSRIPESICDEHEPLDKPCVLPSASFSLTPFCHPPQIIITKSVQGIEPFKEQIQLHSNAEMIKNEGGHINNKSLSIQNIETPKPECDNHHSTLEILANVPTLLNLAAEPDCREAQNQIHPDQNVEQQYICSETDLHRPPYDQLKKNHAEFQKQLIEDELMIPSDLNEQKVQPCKLNYTSSEDILKNFDEATHTAHIAVEVTNVELCTNVNKTCSNGRSHCTENNCEKQLDTKALALETCEPIISTPCKVNSVNVNKCIDEKYLIRNQDKAHRYVSLPSYNFPSFDQKGQCEAKEMFYLPLIQEDQRTPYSYCSDNIPKVFDQNHNVTLEVPACALLESNEHSKTFVTSPFSESDSQIFHEGIQQTKFLFKNDEENNGIQETDNNFCERPAIHTLTSSPHLNIDINEGSSDPFHKEKYKTERELETVLDKRFNSATITDANRGTAVQCQNMIQNNDIYSNIISAANPVENICQKQSLIQQDKSPLLITDGNAINLCSQTNCDSFPVSQEENRNEPSKSLNKSNDINTVFSEIDENVSEHSMGTTNTLLQSTVASILLTNQTFDIPEDITSAYHVSNIIENVTNRGLQNNSVLTISNMGTGDSFMKNVTTESDALSGSEFSIISALNESPNLICNSEICNNILDLNSNAISNLNLVEESSYAQSDCSADNLDTSEQLNNIAVVKNLVYTQEKYSISSSEECFDRTSMQRDIDLGEHYETSNGDSDANVLYKASKMLPKSCKEYTCPTNHNQAIVSSTNTQHYLSEKGTTSGICQDRQSHTLVLRTDCMSAPEENTFLNHEINVNIQSLPETHSAMTGFEETSSLDQLKSIVPENTRSVAKQYSLQQTNEANRFIRKTVGEQDVILSGLDDKTEMNNKSHNLGKDHEGTHTLLRDYGIQAPSDVQGSDIQVSRIVHSNANDTGHKQENDFLPHQDLHLFMTENKESSRNSQCASEDENPHGIFNYSNSFKKYINTCNGNRDTPNALYLGLNNTTDSLQGRAVYADDTANSGLVLPYYEAIMQNEMLTMYDTEKHLKSSVCNSRHDVSENTITTKEIHEECPRTSGRDKLQVSISKPSQESHTDLGRPKEASAETPSTDLILSAKESMLSGPHNISHKIDNTKQHFISEIIAGDAAVEYPSEYSTEELVLRQIKVEPNMSYKVAHCQSQYDGEKLLPASEQFDPNVSSEGCQEESSSHHKVHDRIIFVPEKIKEPSSEIISAVWKQSEGYLTDTASKETDNLLSLKDGCHGSAHVYQNPASTPYRSETAYSIFKSKNDVDFQSTKSQGFSAHHCFNPSNVQIDFNSHLVQESQQTLGNKNVMRNSCQDIDSNEPEFNGSYSVTNMKVKSPTSHHLSSEEHSQATQPSDMENSYHHSISSESILKRKVSEERNSSLFNQSLKDIDPGNVSNEEIIVRNLYDPLNIGNHYRKQESAKEDNEVLSMSSEEQHQAFDTLYENEKKLHCLALNDGLHVAGVYEVVHSVDTSMERYEEGNASSTAGESLSSYASTDLKVQCPNINMSDRLYTSCSEDNFQDNQQNCTLSSKDNPSFEKLSLHDPSAVSQPVNTGRMFTIERELSDHYDTVQGGSKATHSISTSHCQPSICANPPIKPIIDHPSNTSSKPCTDKESKPEDYLKSIAPKIYENTTQEVPQAAIKLDNVGDIDEFHFSSSDINPFVCQWQPGDSTKPGWKPYAFSSASDVSLSKFPFRLEADRLIRCSSVDDGLNSHTSPFHSHLSSYANARAISSNFSSFEDFQTVDDPKQDSIDGPQYYYPLSGETIDSNTKSNEPPFSSNYDLEPKSENCSVQVDEIMLLYTSESKKSSKNNLRVTFEQGTQTELKQRRMNRHQRSQTDVSSVKPAQIRNLHPRTEPWSSVQNMSLHLSQLLYETSELLGNLSQRHVVDLSQGSTVQQEATEASGRIVRDSSTQTTVDRGIQTDLQKQNRNEQHQGEEHNQCLNSKGINVILKVIGTNSVAHPQQNADVTLKQNGYEPPKTTQSLPNLSHFVCCDKQQNQSTIRSSTPLLAGVQAENTAKYFPPSVSPVSPIAHNKEDSSCTEANTPPPSIGHNPIYSVKQKVIQEAHRDNLTCCGNIIMVDRASSPILTLKASKKAPNITIPEQSSNRQGILKLPQHQWKKGYDSHEPQVDNSSQTETDSECTSSQGSSKIVQKSHSLISSRVKYPTRRMISEDANTIHRFRSENCILKDKPILGLNRSSSTSEVSGLGKSSSEYSYLGFRRPNKVDPSSVIGLKAHQQNGVSPQWERAHSLESLSQILQARSMQTRISQPLIKSPSKDQWNDENDHSSFTIQSNNSFFKKNNYTFLSSEMSGFDISCQDEDVASVTESECNTDILLNQDLSIRTSQRSHSYTLQDLPLHNKFSNWSGVQCNPSRTGSLLGSTAELHMRVSPTKTESYLTCDSKTREIERLQRERAEIMSGIHLEVSQQPLTVQLAEAKLNYGIGETDALLRVIQSGKVDNKDATSIRKQLYEGHRKAIDKLHKEREERLQGFRRSRSLSPMKQLSSSQASLISLRESDLPSRRRQYLQQLRKNVVDDTRVQEQKKTSSQCPSEIELMLKDYQKAREEAKTEIAKARDKLRKQAELEKKRLQLSCESKEDKKLKTLMSMSTLGTSSILSLSSGPTSGYNSSITATYCKSNKPVTQETKTSPRNADTSSVSTRGRSAIRNSQLLHSSLKTELTTCEEGRTDKSSTAACKTHPCYMPYNLSLPCDPMSYQEFAKQVQASATAEVMAACSNNLRNLFDSQAASGWKYQCIDRDVLVYYKAFPSATKHGFLGAGVIRRPLQDVWCMVKDVTTRCLYDKSILTAQVHQRVVNGIQLVHVMSDMSLCYLKQPRDFCCISVESKEEKWYSLCFQSLYNESMPRPSRDTVRGEILPSAWLLQSDTADGEEITRIIYMLQVDLGAPAIPSRLLNVVMKRQPLVIASLANFLSK